MLPFEVLISADNTGAVVMSTGTETRARHKDDLEAKQRVYGELSIHTHPAEEGIVANAPSLSDIKLSETVNALRSIPRTEYVVHSEGIVVYRVTKECIKARIDFYKKNKVSFIHDEKGEYRFIQDVSRGERVYLVRRFCEEVGIILDEAAWTNTERVQQIVDDMNRAIRTLKTK